MLLNGQITLSQSAKKITPVTLANVSFKSMRMILLIQGAKRGRIYHHQTRIIRVSIFIGGSSNMLCPDLSIFLSLTAEIQGEF